VLALTSCEIELSVTATTEGSTGIKFYVIELGGKGSATASHNIKLTFAAAGEIFAIQRSVEA
jgi:NTP-dependent ternary system trypsin peptidase co-occuring protein